MKKILMLLSGTLFALGLFWAGATYVQEQNAIKPYAFELQSVDGPVRLSDFKGKMPIVYFGYMYCPDICPTTLALSASALRQLSKEDADKFQLIFISVDPQRDSLKDLKEYAQYFYPDAIGLSGDEATLKEITRHYGTYYVKEAIENSSIDYTVGHTTYLYFFDKKGKLAHTLKHSQDPDKITQVLNEML
ncbi:MAG: SCO family protein [Campylobacterales bacterium]|nr:SCO family protein [Campylobacterales bacterium]